MPKPPVKRYKKKVVKKKAKRNYKVAPYKSIATEKALVGHIYPYRLAFGEFVLYSNGAVPTFRYMDNSATPGFISNSGFIATIIPNSSAVGIGWKFRLTDAEQILPATSVLHKTYDSYRIRKVVIKVDYLNPNIVAPAGVNNAITTIPEMLWYPDYDDGNPPTTFDEVNSRQGMMIRKLEQSKTVTLTTYPRPAQSAYKSSGTFVGYTQGKTTAWMDSTYPDIEYYGLKMLVNNLVDGLNQAQFIRFQPFVYFEFKNPIFSV